MRLDADRKMRRRHGLAARMIAWTVAVTAVVLAAVLYWNHRSVTARMERDARERMMLITEGVAARVDAQLGQVQGLIDGVAQLLEAQKLNVPLDQVHALQKRILREHPGILGVAIAVEEQMRPPGWGGKAPYSRRRADAIETVNLADAGHAALQGDWYQLPKYLDRPIWSEPRMMADGVKRVSYSAPVRLSAAEGPVFAGVVSADIDLDWLDRLVARQPFGEGGYGGILTRGGTFVSHPLEQVAFRESFFSIAEERGDLARRETGMQMVSGEPGSVEWTSWTRAERSWLGWYPLKTADWTMAAVVSRSTLEAQTLRESRDAALLGSLGLVLLVVAVVFVARSITRPIHALSDAVETLSAGNLDGPLPPPAGHDEVARLTDAFGAMRDSLKRHIADLQASTAARERMQGELKVAHDIQMDLVPKTFPAYPHRNDIDLSAMIVPAREVGGDFYDFFLLGDDRLVVAIGDVSGKGVPAALFMAVTRSFLRSEFKNQDDPGKVLTRVNDSLAESNDSCMFVTLFCAVIHLDAGRVDYGNAGHNLPLRLQHDGGPTWVAAPAGSIAAGVMPGIDYETMSFTMTPGDALLLYTDGVTEAMNPAGELFGDARLLSLLTSAGRQSCEATLATVFRDAQRHADGADQSDDITMLMFRWVPPARVAPEAGVRPMTWQTGFRPDAGELATALRRFDEFLDAQQIAPALTHALRFVFEEIATNTIKYGYDDGPAGHRVCVRVSLETPVRIVIEDDGRPFDPLAQSSTPDLDLGVDERPIGGLGIYMVRSMAAHMEYARTDNLNRLTVELPS